MKKMISRDENFIKSCDNKLFKETNDDDQFGIIGGKKVAINKNYLNKLNLTIPFSHPIKICI